MRDDGTVVPWIDEKLNRHTGDWIARTLLSTWMDDPWDLRSRNASGCSQNNKKVMESGQTFFFEGATAWMLVSMTPATWVIALSIVAAIVFVVWLAARERRYHVHEDDAGVPDESDPAHAECGESLQRLGAFPPRDAKRLLALLADHEVPFELEEEYSPGEEKVLYVPLRTSNLVVHVPESSFKQAAAILNQAGFAPEMEQHPGG